MIKYILMDSPNKNKRYRIITPYGRIDFGDPNYDNYTIHKDVIRKQLYINRHQKREDWNDLNSAGFWSRWLLWNKPTINASIKDVEKRFNIKISKLML